MKAIEWTFLPSNLHGSRRHQMRPTGRCFPEETLIKFTPYPRTHARRGFGDDHIMVNMELKISDWSHAFFPENHRWAISGFCRIASFKVCSRIGECFDWPTGHIFNMSYRAQDTIFEEDEVADNLHNALRVEDPGRDERRILRIDLKTVVVSPPSWDVYNLGLQPFVPSGLGLYRETRTSQTPFCASQWLDLTPTDFIVIYKVFKRMAAGVCA